MLPEVLGKAPSCPIGQKPEFTGGAESTLLSFLAWQQRRHSGLGLCSTGGCPLCPGGRAHRPALDSPLSCCMEDGSMQWCQNRIRRCRAVAGPQTHVGLWGVRAGWDPQGKEIAPCHHPQGEGLFQKCVFQGCCHIS